MWMLNGKKNNEVTLWLRHITWVHIHAKFEDLMNTSAVIINTNFEQGGT